MSPATAGEFFGGTRVDLGADEALTAAQDFGPGLVIAETADFLGPLAASRLGAPWASHGVGIAVGAPLAEAMWATAAAQASPRRTSPPSSRQPDGSPPNTGC
jgi:hypothetical protein